MEDVQYEEFKECPTCITLGSNPPCEACQHNRALIGKLEQVVKSLTDSLMQASLKEPPLLICVSCRNTESPAGAMARTYFNHGLCMHCGGAFKVVRA